MCHPSEGSCGALGFAELALGAGQGLGKLTVALYRNFHLLLDLVLDMVLAHFAAGMAFWTIVFP